MLAAERQQVPFDAAATEVIHHLIRGTPLAIRQREKLLHVGAIEVGNTPLANVSLATQGFECVDGFRERNVTAPMQEIEVEAVGAAGA